MIFEYDASGVYDEIGM